MLSRFVSKPFAWRAGANTRMIVRNFAEAKEKKPLTNNQKMAILFSICIPTGWFGWEYATNKYFHEKMDEKYLHHVGWVMRLLNKWFPMSYNYAFSIRKSTVANEVKESLATVFTEMDLALKNGVSRKDAVEYFAMVLSTPVSEDLVKQLEQGYYLMKCISTVHNLKRQALHGLDKVMSIDEFILFAEAVLGTTTQSPAEFCEKLTQAREAFFTQKDLHESAFSEERAKTDHFLGGAGIQSILIPFIRSTLQTKFGIDEVVAKKYFEEKWAREEKEAKKAELENRMAILQWDMSQMYEEISELKKVGDDYAKERIAMLYDEMTEMKKEVKEIKNELYYL